MIQHEFHLKSQHDGRIFNADVRFIGSKGIKPIIIFLPGFKGFKDWGPFDKMADWFARQGYMFVKTNFSHNGTTIDHPDSSTDLEAFGKNTFSKELDDIGTLLDYLHSGTAGMYSPDLGKIFMIGHSRGGCLALLKAHEDKRIKKVVTWAAIDSPTRIFPMNHLAAWKSQGVWYVDNARTGQKMPINYSLYEDFLRNPKRLILKDLATNIKQSVMVIHGTNDQAVPLEAAHNLQQWLPKSRLLTVTGADHTFGESHPSYHKGFAPNFQKIIEQTRSFCY